MARIRHFPPRPQKPQDRGILQQQQRAEHQGCGRASVQVSEEASQHKSLNSRRQRFQPRPGARLLDDGQPWYHGTVFETDDEWSKDSPDMFVVPTPTPIVLPSRRPKTAQPPPQPTPPVALPPPTPNSPQRPQPIPPVGLPPPRPEVPETPQQIPPQVMEVAEYIKSLPVKRGTGFPARNVLRTSEHLIAEFDRKYGYLRHDKSDSLLRKWVGDERLFSKEMWEFLAPEGTGVTPKSKEKGKRNIREDSPITP